MISFVGTKKTMVKINERTTGDLVILWMPFGWCMVSASLLFWAESVDGIYTFRTVVLSQEESWSQSQEKQFRIQNLLQRVEVLWSFPLDACYWVCFLYPICLCFLDGLNSAIEWWVFLDHIEKVLSNKFFIPTFVLLLYR